MARLRSELALLDAGEWLRDLRAIGSPMGETARSVRPAAKSNR